MPQPDWSQLQSFCAVAEHGSLSAAARALGNSQPTLSRHIAQLETSLGARLFERSRGGMALSETGQRLMEHAQHMADAAARLSMVVDGRDAEMAGTVRITASQIVATYLLPDIICALRIKYPDIAIEIVASDTTENLLRREADIALRMYRPTQPDVIARHVTDLPIAAYAAHSYLARAGRPETLQEYRDHVLIGYDRNTAIIKGFEQAGLAVSHDDFSVRTDDQVVCWKMVVAGCGIGFGQICMGDSDPRVARISGAEPMAYLPVWLTAHPELRSTPRIRRVFDWLAMHLSDTTASHTKKRTPKGPA